MPGAESCLTAHFREHGVVVHALSGGIDMQSSELFDELKVALKRGKIVWLHIVLGAHWTFQERVVTRVVKLFRVAHRCGIWWSIENTTTSELWCSNKVRSLCEEGDVHCVQTLSSQVCTHVVSWDEQMDLGSPVNKIWELLSAIPADSPSRWMGLQVLEFQDRREQCEEENECAIGGLRNAARSMTKLPNWRIVGSKVAAIIEELVDQHEEALNPVSDGLGDKTKSHMVPDTLCAILRQPGPGGCLIRGLTEAALDFDVHIHGWLRGRSRWESQFRLHLVEFSQWPHTKERAEKRPNSLSARESLDVENHASHEERKSKADELLRNEISKGEVQWAVNRRDVEQDEGALQLAKIAVVAKGEKVRLIHDVRRYWHQLQSRFPGADRA